MNLSYESWRNERLQCMFVFVRDDIWYPISTWWQVIGLIIRVIFASYQPRALISFQKTKPEPAFSPWPTLDGVAPRDAKSCVRKEEGAMAASASHRRWLVFSPEEKFLVVQSATVSQIERSSSLLCVKCDIFWWKFGVLLGPTQLIWGKNEDKCGVTFGGKSEKKGICRWL